MWNMWWRPVILIVLFLLLNEEAEAQDVVFDVQDALVMPPPPANPILDSHEARETFAPFESANETVSREQVESQRLSST